MGKGKTGNRIILHGSKMTVLEDSGTGWSGKSDAAVPLPVSGSFKVKLTSVSSTPPAALYEALTGESFADRDVLVNGQPMRAHKLFDAVVKGMEK